MEPFISKNVIFCMLFLAFGLSACTQERKQSDYGEYFNTDASTSIPVSQKDSISSIEKDSLIVVADSAINI